MFSCLTQRASFGLYIIFRISIIIELFYVYWLSSFPFLTSIVSFFLHYNLLDFIFISSPFSSFFLIFPLSHSLFLIIYCITYSLPFSRSPSCSLVLSLIFFFFFAIIVFKLSRSLALSSLFFCNHRLQEEVEIQSPEYLPLGAIIPVLLYFCFIVRRGYNFHARECVSWGL